MAPSFDATAPAGHEPLRRLELCAVCTSLLVLILFAILVVHRSAFQETRHTDATVYFRAAWALRTGASLYEVADENQLHYAYPPLLAILLAPLADAPSGVARDWQLPYEVSVSLWILLMIMATALAIDWFARGLEQNALTWESRLPPPFSRRWWYNRLVPPFVCIAPLGCTYSRGQITPVVLLCVAGMFLAQLQRRNFRSGLWLAAAICLKVIPALLLLYPLLRRDGKALAGAVAGCFIGLAIIPAVVLGPTRALEVSQQFMAAVIMPGLNLGESDTPLFEEMMSMRRPGCQSIRATIHNYQFWDRETRPDRPSALTTAGHAIASIVLLGGLVIVFQRRRLDDAIAVLTMMGALLTVMILISPEAHTHYFCLPIPLVMALAQGALARQPSRFFPPPRTMALLIFAGFCFAIVMVPFWSMRREAGIPLYGSLALWGAALRQLARGTIRTGQAQAPQLAHAA